MPALMRTIVGQQVSVAAAASMWSKFEAFAGPGLPPERVLAGSFDELRACGLSRQKQGYLRSLCELVAAGALDFAALPGDDEEAIARLTLIKGIGRWSAEIYLLFAEGRPDIWPAGDLAVQAGLAQAAGAGRTAVGKRDPRRWRKPGGRTAARRRSSPGIATTTRRCNSELAKGEFPRRNNKKPGGYETNTVRVCEPRSPRFARTTRLTVT